MKALVLAAIASSSLTGPSKPPVPGTYWGQKYPLSLSKYKVVDSEHPDIQSWEASIGGADAYVLAVFTPTSRKLWKVSFVYGEPESFDDHVSTYQRYRQSLIKKYGEPSSSFDFFSSPYEKGDGYEDTALKSGKYTLTDYWLNFTETVVSIKLLKSGYTRIDYENLKLSEVDKAERDKIREDSI